MKLPPEARHAARSGVVSPRQLRVGALLVGVLLLGAFVAAPISGPAARERSMPPGADAPGAGVEVQGWPAPGAGASAAAGDKQASSTHSPPASRTTSVALFVADTLGRDGIPTIALQAYQQAEQWASRAHPSCGLDWSLLAAIGRAESDHGRFDGATLHPDGTSTPAIIGIALDGTRSAIVRDTDGGRLDGDTSFDHAVGPMQFIPSTWARFGQDGNGDGRADVFNIFDAARAAADYLCSAGGDLASRAGVERAVLSYNPSPSYLREVLALAAFYAGHPVSASAAAMAALPVDPPRRSRTLPPADPAPAPATLTPEVAPPGTTTGSAPSRTPSVRPTGTTASSATPRISSSATHTTAAPSTSPTPATSPTPTADSCSPEPTTSATTSASPSDETPTPQPGTPTSGTPTSQPGIPASSTPTSQPITPASSTSPLTSAATARSTSPTSESPTAAPSSQPSADCPTVSVEPSR